MSTDIENPGPVTLAIVGFGQRGSVSVYHLHQPTNAALTLWD
jgi:hypothetical protein